MGGKTTLRYQPLWCFLPIPIWTVTKVRSRLELSLDSLSQRLTTHRQAALPLALLLWMPASKLTLSGGRISYLQEAGHAGALQSMAGTLQGQALCYFFATLWMNPSVGERSFPGGGKYLNKGLCYKKDAGSFIFFSSHFSFSLKKTKKQKTNKQKSQKLEMLVDTYNPGNWEKDGSVLRLSFST